MKRFHDGRDWFFEKRYGLFVHWGLYAVPGWHEQIQWRRNVPKAEYVKLVDRFDPVNYNPDAWLDLVQEAGMEYICITAKHHDGFCMWDTAETEYKITNTPYGKDVLAMLAQACHRRGIRLCIYYSCPDWHHPNSLNLGASHQLDQPNPGDEPDLMRYADYVAKQIRELCTGYGQISSFFWDIPPGVKIPRLNALLRELQPGIMINDRGYGPGDYATPERHVPEGCGFTKPTEACQSVGRQSWGYREDEDYYSDRLLMGSLDKIMAMGGNYLLNVGPKADGTIPEESAAILRRIGTWFARIKESFYDAEPASNLIANKECMLTRKGNDLYVHFPDGVNSTGVVLNPIAAAPARATVLNTGETIRAQVELLPSWFRAGAYLRLADLPVNEIGEETLVLKLEFEDLDAGLAVIPDAPEAQEYLL